MVLPVILLMGLQIRDSHILQNTFTPIAGKTLRSISENYCVARIFCAAARSKAGCGSGRKH